MPCRSDYDDNCPELYEECQKELDKVTRILCNVFQVLETSYWIQHFSSEAQEWWKEHKKKDAIRKQKEEEVRKVVIERFEAEVKVHSDKLALAQSELARLKKAKP